MVEVRPLEADGILAERAIAYIEADGLAVRQYSYHFWIEAPTQAVQRELSNYLRATGLFGEVVTPRLRARPDIEVQGRIGRFEQILDGNGGSRVMIELELGASHTGRGLELLFLETYRVETPAPDGTPTGASIAFREGLGEIFDRFGSDLAIRLAAQ